MMEGIPQDQLLDAGVHFGHLRKKWNPKMLPNIFMERKGIHIIDLNKTNESLVRAASAMKNIARSGKKILFVATKKQAKEVVTEAARRVNMPYVTERGWAVCSPILRPSAAPSKRCRAFKKCCRM